MIIHKHMATLRIGGEEVLASLRIASEQGIVVPGLIRMQSVWDHILVHVKPQTEVICSDSELNEAAEEWMDKHTTELDAAASA